MSTDFKLLISNAKQLVCISDSGQLLKKGKDDMNELHLRENYSVVVSNDGKIADIGPAAEIDAKYAGKTFEQKIDASNKAVLPGFVDGHTHPVWAGDRVHEFAMKLAGATYMDIHKAGGGIGFTVQHTKEASLESLVDSFKERLDRMLKFGTTTVEAKSGYGLELDTEVKMLKAIHEANKSHVIDIVANYCGGHSIPKGSDAATATEDIIKNQIPTIKKMREEGEINPELIDVFCEKGVFEYDDTEKILAAGKEAGLDINFHGDELNPINSGVLGAKLGARAISHLEHLSEEGIKAMAGEDVIGVVLPTTHYLLHLKDPPVREMIEGGVPVALGTDFNPNAFCLSMPMTMNMACVNYKMTMNEALVASTLNSAASMNRSGTQGSIEVGKCGDFVILDAPKWENVIYQIGDPPIGTVVKMGSIVHQV